MQEQLDTIMQDCFPETFDHAYLQRQLTDMSHQQATIDQAYKYGSDLWAYETYQLRRMREAVERMLQKASGQTLRRYGVYGIGYHEIANVMDRG
jgi:hypothetical protein